MVKNDKYKNDNSSILSKMITQEFKNDNSYKTGREA